MLDLAQGHSAVHRVFVQRVAVEIDHLGPGQHHAVVVRFVAIAVHQNDVTGPNHRLHDNLVAGGCAVGGKEGLLGAKGPAGQFLRAFDRPVRFQQAVEPAGRGRGFGQKDIGPVKRAHVLNPVRPRDRFAATDRHGMEHAGGLFGIVHQCGEEGRLVACLDTAQDVEVQFHEVFLIVEDTAADAQIQPGNVFDRTVRDKIGVKFGAHAGNQAAEFRAINVRLHCVDGIAATGAVEKAVQDFVLVA